MELNQLLVWLSAGGAVVVISWCAENFGWFQSLQPIQKRLAMWAASCVLGSAALAVTLYVPADVLAAAAPFMGVLIANFGTIFLGELYHKFAKEPKG